MDIFSKSFPVDALISQAYSGESIKPQGAFEFTFHGAVADFPGGNAVYVGFLTFSADASSPALIVRGVNLVLPTAYRTGQVVMFDHLTADDTTVLCQFVGWRSRIDGDLISVPAV